MDRRKLIIKRIIVWFLSTTIGFALGQFFLSDLLEQPAAGFLYNAAQSSKSEPRVRFIDFSHLYEIGENRLSIYDLMVLLDVAANLDENHRPAAIGIDLPVVRPLFPDDESTFVSDPEADEFFGRIRELEDEQLPVIIAVNAFQKVNLVRLEEEFPGTNSRLASSNVYSKGELASKWFGSGERTSTMPSFAIALIQAYLNKGMDTIEAQSPGVEPRHLVAPPAEWPQDIIEVPEWFYVDYSIISRRDELTVVAGSQLAEVGPVTTTTLFSEEDLAKLRNADPTRPTFWIVGIGQVEDTFTFDEKTKWVSSAIPLRGMYHHGAIAHTYLEAPLRRPGFRLDILLSFLVSSFALAIILISDKYNFRPPVWQRVIWRILMLLVLAAIALAIAYTLARFRWFWFGFSATIVYVFLETIVLEPGIHPVEQASEVT